MCSLFDAYFVWVEMITAPVKLTRKRFKQNIFEICSGLNMKIDKTKAKIIGPEPHPTDSLFGLDWTGEILHTLGVTIAYCMVQKPTILS